ncbi:LamB/YcsF family protein [Deinococcus sp. AJ005]|uniref:LamB/YcsF family protein n=1 Tax=Deinococcus sp. AJ005 TaxID=2652443 RepID=UPI00125CAA45|nr:5-oxoprolinase subunit PxpA [Deinococcus sp. AJ005]QFP75110.1 LamB/YcsF family protein [Deinococcus sp. AJ005]
MTRTSIDLNADAGESYGAWTLGDDAGLFPLLSSVNIACGFHAGDPLTMQGTVALAKKHGLGIGAHPSYPDLPGFGRRIMESAPDQVYADTLYQISALAGMARAAGVPLQHVKAHGALSTRAWTHAPTAAAIAQATRDFDPDLPLMVLPATLLETEARRLGVPVVLETFPERAYLQDGRLAPRSMPGSSIHDPAEAARRAVMMVTQGRVEAIDGGFFEFEVNSLCIHGDNPNAVQIAQAVHEALNRAGVEIRSFSRPELP